MLCEGVEGLALEMCPCLSIGVDVSPALDASRVKAPKRHLYCARNSTACNDKNKMASIHGTAHACCRPCENEMNLIRNLLKIMIYIDVN